MLDNVSLYGYITLYLSIYQFGSIMNNTAMNVHLQVLYGHMFSVFLGIYLGVELLGDMLNSMFNIFRNYQTVFQRGNV